MNQVERKAHLRAKRKKRIRGRLEGTTERPRLSVYRSAKHMFAQVIDDVTGKTLASVGSFSMDKRATREVCAELGKSLAAKCKEKSIGKIAFDKNGFAYHGRVKAFADGAREGGLEF
jgi:large subunit ribosomal protein L18